MEEEKEEEEEAPGGRGREQKGMGMEREPGEGSARRVCWFHCARRETRVCGRSGRPMER